MGYLVFVAICYLVYEYYKEKKKEKELKNKHFYWEEELADLGKVEESKMTYADYEKKKASGIYLR